MVALSVKELLHSAESSVRLKHVPEEFQKPAILKREMWGEIRGGCSSRLRAVSKREGKRA